MTDLASRPQTATVVTVHHGNGYAYLYPVITPAEAVKAVAATATSADELVDAAHDAEVRWRHVEGRAQYGYCDAHHDEDGQPIRVMRTVATVRCVSCSHVQTTKIVCGACDS